MTAGSYRKSIWPAAIMGFALLCGAVQAAGPMQDSGGAHCQTVPAVQSWQPLSETEVLVWPAGDERSLHIQLLLPCFRLLHTDDVTLSIDDGRLCGRGIDTLTVRSSVFDRYDDDIQTPQACPIDKIRRIDAKERDTLLERFSSARQKMDWPAAGKDNPA